MSTTFKRKECNKKNKKKQTIIRRILCIFRLSRLFFTTVSTFRFRSFPSVSIYQIDDVTGESIE